MRTKNSTQRKTNL